MKLSLNWIKQYTQVNLPVDELVTKIGSQLGEVEGVEDLAPKYRGAVIVKVVSCVDHPNADRLHVCLVDDGGVTADVERDEQGLVQVVCGAPNVRGDLLAVWLPPGATVPSTYGSEPFVLEARELRGVVSNGMLASPKELALGDSHEGILEVDPGEWSPKQADIKPGADFAAVFGLDDTVIDIENKMFTHRPDLFGQLGLAREVAGITGRQFESPQWYAGQPALSGGEGLQLEVRNEAPALVPRLMAVALKNVSVKPSPLWLQAELVRVGAKPINNIVDITNYIMLLTAQPTHAYDYDKLRGGQLVARRAGSGETAELLNHKSYELTENDIVIADGQGTVGLGGIMGGGNSEVSDQTVNIVLECASFDMYAVRRSSMRHGLFTDAVTRFSKGQSPLQNPNVLQLLVQSIQDVAGGEVASQVFDEHGVLPESAVVTVSASFINSRLGLDMSVADMARLLINVEFEVQVDNDELRVTAPFWRTDIAIAEDVVEEIGRLQGYDSLPLELPQRAIRPAAQDSSLVFKSKVRASLIKAGANELLTYSFVHGKLLEKADQDKAQAYRVANALSPDLQYYRLTALPSLLDKVHANIKAGHDQFALFELSSGHDKSAGLNEEQVPLEFEDLDFIYASKQPQPGAPFYRARRYLDALAADLGVELQYRPLTDLSADPVTDPYDPARSAQVYGGEEYLGIVGEFKPAVRRGFKLPDDSAGFTISPAKLRRVPISRQYRPLPRFPKVEQDICLRVPASVAYGEMVAFLRSRLEDAKPPETLLSVSPLDIYQRPDEPEYKQVTFRISLASYERTLTDQEMSGLLSELSNAAAQQFNAERI